MLTAGVRLLHNTSSLALSSNFMLTAKLGLSEHTLFSGWNILTGEVAAECHSHRHSARCDIKEEADGCYTLRVLPTESEKHVLHITYDGHHVPGQYTDV